MAFTVVLDRRSGYAPFLAALPFPQMAAHPRFIIEPLEARIAPAAAVFELASLDGSNGFKISNGARDEFVGGSISDAGDVNGDGFGDIIIGGSDNGAGLDSGKTYLVFGKSSGFGPNLNLSTLDGSNGFVLTAATANDLQRTSVSGAGDVNNDGFSDLIIGSPFYGSSSGVSYVVFGKAGGFSPSLNLSTLDGSNGFRVGGLAVADNAGISVSTAGDVNGDGFGDIIIGAPGADANGDSSGTSYVVFGKAGGFSPSLNLSTLDGSNGFQLSGVSVGDWSGYSVSTAGDVNGDGFGDLIIGTNNVRGAASNSIYVVFGKAGAFAPNLNLSALDGSNGFRLAAVAPRVSTAGDVNGDGFGDLIIGDEVAAPNGIRSGASYVVFGKASGFAPMVNLSTLDGSNGFTLLGVADGDRFGKSVSGAGDVNGDGFDDVIIGAPGVDRSGASYLVFGKASGFAASVNLAAIHENDGFIFNGATAYGGSGMCVSGAGDFNGDGFEDLVIGAPFVGYSAGRGGGASYVVFGGEIESRPSLTINDVTVIEPSMGTATASFTVSLLFPSTKSVTVQYATADGTATAPDDYIAVSLSTLTFAPGETTKSVLIPIVSDGVYEVPETFIVNLSNATNATLPDPEGVASILEGPSVFYASSLNGSNGFVLTATGTMGNRPAISAGDVNGDGFDDVVVGASQEGSGVSYVVFGKADGFVSNLNLSAIDGVNGFKLSGVAAFDQTGFSVSAAGDVNRDGFDDLIIGSPSADPNGTSSGASYVVFGKAAGFPANLNLSTLNGSDGFKLNGVNPSDEAGRSVSAAGDVNGDGFGDLIVGAPYADPNGISSGASYVVFGKPSGFAANINLSSLDGNAGFRIDGIAAGKGFGYSVNGAGDVNGDGFDELIIGASNGPVSYVVFGKGSGFAANVDLSTLDGTNGFNLTDPFGTSIRAVSGAGDVNGDGFDDIILSSPLRSFDYSSTARSYVVFGKASAFAPNVNLSMLDGSNGFKLTGTGNSGNNGDRAVSAAGDLNSDGFGDIIVGAPGTGPSSASVLGSAYVVFGKASGFVADVSLSALDGSNGFQVRGAATGDRFGAAVTAGDVNGDHVADLIIGTGSSSYVVFGNHLEDPPSLSINDVTVAEGAAGTVMASFAVTLSSPSSQTITVQYSTANGSASVSADYLPIGSEVLTFNPGEVSKTVVVRVNGDAAVELDETFFVDLSNPINATIADGQGQGTISNDDLPSLRINDATVNESMGGTVTASFTITLSDAINKPVSVKYATADGTAVAPGDYTSLGLTQLTFAPGELSKTVTVPVNGDAGVEADETFFLFLSEPTNAAIADAEGRGTILNDDGPGPFLSINDTTIAESADGTVTASFTVTLSEPSSETVRVQYATANGNATSPMDYAALGLTLLTFEPGEVSKTVSVSVNGDTLFEPDEAFFINLKNPINAAIADAEAKATIVNDDVSGPALSVSDALITEPDSGSANAAFTVTLSERSSRTVKVQYATANGTALALSDYTPTGLTTLTFDPGEVSKTILVTINGDTTFEGDERFFVNLSDPINAAIADNQGEGRIFNDDSAAVLELASLAGSNGFKISGLAAGGSYGNDTAVSDAGDVNGDGFDDFMIGAAGADSNGISNSGAIYVVFGRTSGFPADLDVATLDGSNGFKLSGVQVSDRAGASLSAAGDINGDGFDDMIVGAFAADANGVTNSGAAYVIFGKGEGFASNLNLSTLDGRNGFKIDGGAIPFGNLGSSVTGAGDINRDGFDDVMIAASRAGANDSAGASYVIFGKANGFNARFDVSMLDGANGFEISSADVSHALGRSVSGAGDINADGFADLILGSSLALPGLNVPGQYGASYVVFGKSGGFAPKLNLATLDGSNGFKISSDALTRFSSETVSAVGDFNGDGFDDVIVGEPSSGQGYANASYIIFGKANGFSADLKLSSLNGSNGFKISSAAFEYLGSSLSAAGDFNRDGFDDVIIGAFAADSNGLTNSGAAYVIFGKGEGFASNLNLSTLDGRDGFKLNGGAAYDFAGSSLSTAGDINGDGFDDVIIGARGADPNGDNSGASYVVFGNRFGPPPLLPFFSISDVDIIEGDAGVVFASFTVTLSAPSAKTVSVQYATADGTATASRGDYTAVPLTTLTFNPGEISKTVLVSVNGNSALEPHETFFVDLSSPSNATIADPRGVGTIVNDDGTDPSFSVNDVSVLEGHNGPATAYVVVTLSTASAQAVSVQYATADGTATASKDYTPIPLTTLTFNPGEVNKAIAVQVLGDTIRDGNKAFSIVLSNATNAAIDDPIGILTVLDDDVALVGKRKASFTDVDGDRAIIKVSKGMLKVEDFVLVPAGFGAQLALIDLAGQMEFAGASLSITAKHVSEANNGDGMVNIGHLNLAAIDFGKVLVEGDLGRFTAGNALDPRPGLGRLEAHSLGQSALLTQTPGGSMQSVVVGVFGRLKIAENVHDAELTVTGDIGAISIAGSVLNTAIRSDGTIGAIKISGDLSESATISALGNSLPTSKANAFAIKSLSIGGSIDHTQILAGYDINGAALNADAGIGRVTLGGNWTASDLVAGVRRGADGMFGTGDDLLIEGGNEIVARIASIVIRGEPTGAEEGSNRFGVVAEQIGAFKSSGTKLTLTPGARNDLAGFLLGSSDDIIVREVS